MVWPPVSISGQNSHKTRNGIHKSSWVLITTYNICPPANISGQHSNQNQVWCVNIGKCTFLGVHRGFWLLCPPVVVDFFYLGDIFIVSEKKKTIKLLFEPLTSQPYIIYPCKKRTKITLIGPWKYSSLMAYMAINAQRNGCKGAMCLVAVKKQGQSHGSDRSGFLLQTPYESSSNQTPHT